MFASAGELLIWRNEIDQWVSRLIKDAAPGTQPEWTQAFEEQQILWGTHATLLERDFTLMRDGSEGLLHVVPLRLVGQFDEQSRPLRLSVCHYLKTDTAGFVQVDASRLTNLYTKQKESHS